MEDIASIIQADQYNIPTTCTKCGGVMVFKGVGEYQCETCGEMALDDYGKARTYLEEHRGATAAEIEKAVGVSQRSIRKLLRDGRLEIAEGSKAFLRCDLCGKSIRYGQFCSECEMKAHQMLEEKQREMLRKAKNMQVYGKNEEREEGQRRFMRGEN